MLVLGLSNFSENLEKIVRAPEVKIELCLKLHMLMHLLVHKSTGEGAPDFSWEKIHFYIEKLKFGH